MDIKGKIFGYDKKRIAFTLSEILLTMTIVGVVAAMTIPTLHYQKVRREYTVKLKNFYSKMENAVLDMQLDYGSFKDMEKPATNSDAYDWYMSHIDPYVGHQYVRSGRRTIYYKDGSSLYLVSIGGCLDVIFDVNGDKRPNSVGRDQYYFLYCFEPAARIGHFGNEDIFLELTEEGLHGAGISRRQALNACSGTATCPSAGGASPACCSRLLQLDQWEYKDDYPYKF